MSDTKSTIKKLNELDYGQEFEIKQLHADKDFIEFQRKKLKEMRPNAKPEDIDRQIANIVARNNSIDLIIDGISKHFQFNINDEDLKAFAERIKNNVLNDVQQNMSNDTMKNMVKNEETLKNIALSTLKRNLLFKELAKLWDVRVSDEEVKTSLDNYYAATNMPIRDILNDKAKFESVRDIMLNEKIGNELLHRFRIKFNLPEPPKKPDNSKNNN